MTELGDVNNRSFLKRANFFEQYEYLVSTFEVSNIDEFKDSSPNFDDKLDSNQNNWSNFDKTASYIFRRMLGVSLLF